MGAYIRGVKMPSGCGKIECDKYEPFGDDELELYWELLEEQHNHDVVMTPSRSESEEDEGNTQSGSGND